MLQHRQSRAARARIRWLATFDAASGALQPHALHERLEASPGTVAGTGLIALELHRFALVGATLGAARAGEMLSAVVRDLRAMDRVLALARFGEHEFVAWVRAGPGEVESTARLLREALHLALPTERGGVPMGVVALDDYDGTPREAVAAARLTRARAGAAGEGAAGEGIAAFDAAHVADIVRRRRQEVDLPGALARDELRLAYQPQIDLRTGRCVGVEALVRWIHPEMGFMRPDEFVAVAEAGGLITELGAWVLERACREIGPLEGADGPLKVSVNVSPQQFLQSEVGEVVARTLRRTRLPAERLELEITESLAIDDPAVLRAALAPLRLSGVSVALDDFGSGYANLGVLGGMPLDKLKLDRSLILDLPDRRATATVAAAIAIARGHGLRTVVEGVEDERTAELLRVAGCDVGQGYLWSRPLPPHELIAFLDAEREAAAAPATGGAGPVAAAS